VPHADRIAVHQVVPTFARRDAIGGHALLAQRLLRAEGFSSQIFTASAPRHLRHLVRDVRALPSGLEDLFRLASSGGTGAAGSSDVTRKEEPCAVS